MEGQVTWEGQESGGFLWLVSGSGNSHRALWKARGGVDRQRRCLPCSCAWRSRGLLRRWRRRGRCRLPAGECQLLLQLLRQQRLPSSQQDQVTPIFPDIAFDATPACPRSVSFQSCASATRHLLEQCWQCWQCHAPCNAQAIMGTLCCPMRFS